jgi:metal-responsive CopG/Arc/MetJ family transcriptional regulator
MTKPVQISLDEELLNRIDRDPEAKRVGRSAFIRAAVRVYLHARRRRTTDEQIAAAYSDEDKKLSEEVEALIGQQAWPEY